MAQRKSVLVSGIPPGVTKEQLQIHFQRSRNGGGDVNSVLFPLASSKKTALVTFEKEDVCNRVLETTQLFDEHWLELKPLPQQVYSCVYAVIDGDVVKSIPVSRFDSIIQSIQNETGVIFEYKELNGNNECLLQGNWYQIQSAQKLLQKLCGASKDQGRPTSADRRDNASKTYSRSAVNGPTSDSDPLEANQLNGLGGDVHNGVIGDDPIATAILGSSFERPPSRGKQDYSVRDRDVVGRQPERPPSRGKSDYHTSATNVTGRQPERPPSRGKSNYGTSTTSDIGRQPERPPSRGKSDYGTNANSDIGRQPERPPSRGKSGYGTSATSDIGRQPERPPSRGKSDYRTSTSNDIGRQPERPPSRGRQDYVISNGYDLGRSTERPPSRSGIENFEVSTADDRRSTERPPSRGARDYGTGDTFITQKSERPPSRSRQDYDSNDIDAASYKRPSSRQGRDDVGISSSVSGKYDKPDERPPSRGGREEQTVGMENHLGSITTSVYDRLGSRAEYDSMPVSDVLSTTGSERPGSRLGVGDEFQPDMETLLFNDSMASPETNKDDIAADMGNFEVCPIAVDIDLYMFMKHTQERKLQSLERDCDVRFSCDETADTGMVNILPKSERTITDQLKLARDQFVVLYDNLYQTIDKFDFHLPKGLDESEVELAVEDAKIKFGNVYFKREKPDHYALYGDKPIIQAAQLHILSKLCKAFDVDGDSRRSDVDGGGGRRKEMEMQDDFLDVTVDSTDRQLSEVPQDIIQPTEDEPQPSTDPILDDAGLSDKLEDDRDEEAVSRREPSGESESDETPPISRPTHGVTVLSDSERELTFLTDHGVKLRLYTADITKLLVDAITNAAHEQLINTGGVAYSIRKAAGRHYHRECEEYIDNHGPLFVTEVIHTGAGILPCKYVMHAVGPRWEDYKNKNECIDSLKVTFVNCFNHANDLLQATSVALPPISAGIFGVPLDMVAQAMFDAVMEFSKEHPRSNGNLTLTDIHFVDYEKSTVNDMRKVFQENLQLAGCVRLEEPRPLSRGAADRPRPGTPREIVTQEQRSDVPLVRKRPSTPPPSLLRGSPTMDDRGETDRRLFSSERSSRPREDEADRHKNLSSSARYTSPRKETRETQKKPMPTDTKGKSAFKQYKVSADLDKYVPTKSASSPRAGITGEKIQPGLRPKTADSYRHYRRSTTENAPMKPMRATIGAFTSTGDQGAVGGDPSKLVSAQDKEALVREILEEHEHGPQSRERSRETQKMLDNLLVDDEFSPINIRGARTRTRSLERGRPKTADGSTRAGRSSSLDRKKPSSGILEKGSTVRRCQLCRTHRNLNTMRDCPHFICSTCKKYSRDCYDCLQLKMGEKDKSSLKVQASTVNPAPSSSSSTTSHAKQQLTRRVQRPRSATPNLTTIVRECPICFQGVTNAKTLPKCQHTFCKTCIDTAMDHKPVCPVCGYIYGPMIGNQPEGTIEVSVDKGRQLPGYGGCGTIIITYNFPNGTQTNEHPNPGRPYQGTKRRAYLPDNTQGREVLKLLQRAFKSKLLFTIGQSLTTGLDNAVVWNDIHQKTSRHGGPANHGYPDPFYLRRVKEELAAKGIK